MPTFNLHVYKQGLMLHYHTHQMITNTRIIQVMLKKHETLANRSTNMLADLTKNIVNSKKEFESDHYFQTYSKAALYKLPRLSRAIVNKTVADMEEAGYEFNKRQAGTIKIYAMTIQNVIDIYNFREVPKLRNKFDSAYTIFIGNLKGGVSKTVTAVTLAHSLRTHPQLLQHDNRCLVIDLDPQSSATMFLNHIKSIGYNDATSAQAMLNNLSREELLEEFIFESIIPGVDIMPASIDDAFLASKWEELCAENLPGQNIYDILKDNVIDKLKGDYDFIFIDSGPHLDAFLSNSLAAADILFTPIPPAQVDFHSTLKYISRIPELLSLIEKSGTTINSKPHLGFMSKIAKKADHEMCHSFAKEIFGGEMLDAVMPRLDAFERCGESFDTVISANPANYGGSKDALKSARNAAETFAKAVFDRVDFIRSN